ncbi:glycosyltransferase family 4 protein [Maribacter litoralis]|uniref:glycosyltransferase family 4 protein n=1 Tax=Maribacter litoralis TaxID=2059726 RepID=UPI000E324DDB|nr:glycosyltransferase family 4 protein [Maribacter litoralis]
MKITFIIFGLNTGGAERAVTGLANYWAADHKVSVITLVKSTPFYPLDTRINLYHCLDAPKSETTVIQSLKDVGKRTKMLTHWLKKEQTEVVISFMTKTNINTLWIAKWVGIPCIGSERANHEINKLPKFHEYLRNFSYKHLNALVVQTQGNHNYYDKIMPKHKINIIPNAVAPVLKENRKDTLIETEKIILNVGAFRNGKAQDVLIRAFAQLPTSNWRLVFLGHGPNLEKFKVLAQQLGVADRISFEGAQKDVASYYNKAAMFVFTSEHEGFPNALLEALYFGVPSISTNCPHGPSDMITDGENGYLVPVGDVETLAMKMQVLMEQPELREKFSQAALASTKKYEMAPIAEQWMQVITSVTSQTK